MTTTDVELKKLVYLYLMNYAKTQPDLAILSVNAFVKDAQDRNPLIRALAVRTMGCIRVDRIVEYLCVPLRKCLKDDDPYVRKTAAICVAKMYDIDPVMVMEQGESQNISQNISQKHFMIDDSKSKSMKNQINFYYSFSTTCQIQIFSFELTSV
jgi:vesicle coat complex subunit